MRFTSRIHTLATFFVTVLSVFATHAQTISAVPGSVDPSFGSDLPVKVRILAEEADYSVRAVAVVSGKVVMAGSCYPPNQPLANRWCFSRHNVDGSFDDTFDGPSGTGNGRFAVRLTTGDDQIRAMAIQADGKMVVVGKCGFEACAARFDTDGTFDLSFGDEGGWTYLRRGGSTQFVVSPTVADVAIQANGKIVVGGTCERLAILGANQGCLWRLNTDGTADTSFDAGSTAVSYGRISVPLGDDTGELRRIAIQSNGRVLVLATCQPVNLAQSTDDKEAKFCFTRLNANGAVDDTFSLDGRLRFSFSSKGAFPNALALQADGKIVAGGECSDGTDTLDYTNQPNGTYFPCLVRLNVNGTIDDSFENPLNIAQTGRFLLKLSATPRFSFGAVRTILVQADGKLVIVFGGSIRVQGRCELSNLGLNLRCAAARLNSDGSFDLLFDGSRGSSGLAGNGIAYVGDENVFTTAVAALRPNGRIVIAGNCSSGDINTAGNDPRMCLQQFNGGDGVQPACTLNVDGSGGVRLASDGLMMLRAMRGAITEDVTVGAGVSANAPRGDWTEIRDYLVESCGATPARGPRLARPATECSLDLDGDNNVSAATDGVLLLRALLGFTGAALIDDVPIVATATRKTPALISGFLTNQCGLSP
jgi:uncharacterized delta-60 repeat protein